MTVTNSANHLEKWILIVLIVTQLAVAAYFGSQKESWHLDEIYTQGLSNSYDQPFIGDADLLEWKTPQFYEDYLTVQAGEQFAYGSVLYNQAQDVHPPLFYLLIHTISSLTPGQFSKWVGLGLNMGFFVGIMLLLFAFSKKYCGSGRLALIVCAAYGFSAGAMSNLMFIRMYVMMTFFGLLFAWIHGEMIRRDSQSTGALIGVFFVAVAGFLTQYLFLVFAFFGFLAYGYRLLRQRRFKDFGRYTVVLAAALAFATLIFPAWVQLFLQGGIETNPAYAAWTRASYLFKTLFFLYYLLRGLFGNVYVAIAVGFLVLAYVLFQRMVRHTGPLAHKAGAQTAGEHRGARMELPQWILWTSLGTCLAILYISPYNDAYRYLSFLVPIWLMALIPAAYGLLAGARWTKAHPAAILAAAIVTLSLFSYSAGSVDYLYQSRADDLDARMDRYAGMPAICVSEDRSNMTVTIPLLARHEASCYVPPDGVGTSVRDMLEKIGSTGKPIIVYLPDWIIEERGTPNLDYVKEIAAACGYSRYEKILGADESGLLTSAYLIE